MKKSKDNIEARIKAHTKVSMFAYDLGKQRGHTKAIESEIEFLEDWAKQDCAKANCKCCFRYFLWIEKRLFELKTKLLGDAK